MRLDNIQGKPVLTNYNNIFNQNTKEDNSEGFKQNDLITNFLNDCENEVEEEQKSGKSENLREDIFIRKSLFKD